MIRIYNHKEKLYTAHPPAPVNPGGRPRAAASPTKAASRDRSWRACASPPLLDLPHSWQTLLPFALVRSPIKRARPARLRAAVRACSIVGRRRQQHGPYRPRAGRRRGRPCRRHLRRRGGRAWRLRWVGEGSVCARFSRGQCEERER